MISAPDANHVSIFLIDLFKFMFFYFSFAGTHGWVGFVGPFPRQSTATMLQERLSSEAKWSHVHAEWQEIPYPAGSAKHRAELSVSVDVQGMVGKTPLKYMHYRSGDVLKPSGENLLTRSVSGLKASDPQHSVEN